jgi:polyphosphate kinase 2 (PPK2 family)
MKIRSKDFRVAEGEAVNLNQRPTEIKPVYKSKKHYKERIEDHVEQLSDLQRLHYASGHYAVLLIFQAMDAAGKDGAIRHVMSGVNPQGCEVFRSQPVRSDRLAHRGDVAVVRGRRRVSRLRAFFRAFPTRPAAPGDRAGLR